MHGSRAVLALVACAALAFPALAREPDDVEGLVQKVVNGTRGEADRALERLRYLGPERAGPPLRALLASRNTRARIAATNALVVVRDPASAAALEARLSDDDWEVRQNAAAALGALRLRRSAKPLQQALGRDTHVRVRKACATALALVPGGANGLATAAAKDRDLEVRLVALDGLARMLDPSVAPKLRPLLADPSGLVRFGAARTLAWLGDASARKFLAAQVSGDNAEGAARAVTVLGDVPKGWAVELLVGATASKDADVRVSAADALARRGDRRGLVQLARSEREGGVPGARASAALERLGIAPAERSKLAEADP